MSDNVAESGSSKKKQYCIIAGAPRCGTTSLYQYLSDHPQICPSFVKQTNYFLDPDYEGVASQPISKTDGYSDLFDSKDKHLYNLEATPDYLYSPNSALSISSMLGENVNLIFILRHPVEQFISLHKHYKRVGMINVESDIDEFIVAELKKAETDEAVLLKKGCYHLHLEKYYHLFPRDKIQILYTELLSENPLKVMEELEVSLDIKRGFYTDYAFVSKNTATEVRSRTILQLYQKLRLRAISLTQNNKILRILFIPARKLVSQIYKSLNNSRSTGVDISESSRAMLLAFYQEEFEKLEELVGIPNPWRHMQ